jgi:hypothetical protein
MIAQVNLVLSTALMICIGAQGFRIKVDFHDGNTKEVDISHGNLTAEDFLRSPRGVPVSFGTETSPDKRQDGPCLSSTVYSFEKVGDGNPHQNYKIGQVANTLISCPGSVSQGESHTFGWSIGLNINPGVGESDFANLGFAVSESQTNSVTDTFPCVGGMTEICALHYTAVTAVTVEFFSQVISCDGIGLQKLPVGTGIVYLPNADGIGSVMSRGTNFGDRNIIQCRGSVEREVDFHCGPRGGPEWFDTNEYGPWSDAYMAALEPAGCAVPIEALKFLS